MASFTKTTFGNESAPYLSDTELNALQDKINNALKAATDLVDYTSQITAVKGTINGGKVYKIGRVAYWQIAYTSTETINWAQMITFPAALEPLVSKDNKIYIQGENKDVHGSSSSTPLQIRGPKISGETSFMTFSYITKS